jgi:hypothetical protein
MGKQDANTTYAAAETREFLRGRLKDKENEWIYPYAGLVDDPQSLDLLNYFSSLARDRGGRFVQTPVGETVLRSAATRMGDRAYREGNVSQLKGMVGLTKKGGEASEALTEIARRLSDEGAICFLVGPPGAGKTATMVDVTRVWGALTGGRVFSNLDWDGSDGLVETDREMFERMASFDGPALAALDELSQKLTGRGRDAANAARFAKSLTLVRKKESKHGRYAKRGSVVGVAHTMKSLAPELRRLATLIIQKPRRADPGFLVLYESPGGSDELEKIGEYQGLTDTRERYNQHEASSFSVATADDQESGDGDVLDPDDVRREEAIQTTLKLAKPWDDDGGMSYREISGVVGYSTSWIGDRIGEWKNGEHRDVLDDAQEATA